MTEVPSLCASATAPHRGAQPIAGVDAALGTAFSSGGAANDGFASTLPIAASERLGAAATLPRPNPTGQAFGGVDRLQIDMEMRCDPATSRRLEKAMKSIEYSPSLDNRAVRRRNQKAVETLSEGVTKQLLPVMYNLAELYYNGAPGIPPDHNRTLEL